MVGLGAMLNLGEREHVTVVVSDFDLTPQQRARIASQFGNLPTKLAFVRASSAVDLEEQLTSSLRASPESYVSLQLLSSRHETYAWCSKIFHALPRKDMARLELPPEGLGFESAHLDHLLGVLERSDFAEQQRYSDLFFRLLESAAPYEVEVYTAGARLTVRGADPWFQLAGPLTPGETRILPGGEVAYTGDDVSGTFVADGTLLATPQGPEAIDAARALKSLMPELRGDPVTLTIERGAVTGMRSRGRTAERLGALLENVAYAQLVEVGVSFNRACRALVYGWPASANEGYPGAHIGVGGDPVNGALRKEQLVHVDLISADAQIFVNRQRFLATADLTTGTGA